MTADEALEVADEPVRNGNDQYHACNTLAAEVRRLREESRLFRDASEAAELRIVELRARLERLE